MFCSLVLIGGLVINPCDVAGFSPGEKGGCSIYVVKGKGAYHFKAPEDCADLYAQMKERAK